MVSSHSGEAVPGGAEEGTSEPSLRPRLADAVRRELQTSQSRIVVTGASGWLGRATLELLEEALGAPDLQRRVTAYASAERHIVMRSGTAMAARPLATLRPKALAGATLLHFAFRFGDPSPPALAHENAAITTAVLGAFAGAPPRGMFLPSSGAVYGLGGRARTDLAGHPYGTLKHLDELVFEGQCAREAVPLVVARIFNVSGQHMTPSYALPDLVLRALAGHPLVVHARGRVLRSYVAFADVLSVALGTLGVVDPPAVTRFDTAGEEIVEIGQLAERVASALGHVDLPIERVIDEQAPADEYVGAREPFESLAQALGVELQPLDEQIRTTAADLRMTLD